MTIQLRCAQTSELLAEGTPLEIATLADVFPRDEVVFDGVSPEFDPAAVRKGREDEIAGLQASLAEMPARTPAGEDPEAFKQRRENLKATIAERKDRIAAGKALAASARERLGEARDRLAELQR